MDEDNLRRGLRSLAGRAAPTTPMWEQIEQEAERRARSRPWRNLRALVQHMVRR
jgi:hypothetical protein